MNIPQPVIDAARAADRKWGVPASVSIAQWALESAWGAHAPGNNCFGIKALAGYGVQQFTTHEVVRGHSIECVQRFAKFASLTEAFDCHAKLLATAPVYAAALRCAEVNAFVAAMAPHYATDPLYAQKIMQIIRVHHLQQFDGNH